MLTQPARGEHTGFGHPGTQIGRSWPNLTVVAAEGRQVANLTRERKVKVKVAQSCPTLCDPMDYTIYGILQARILEWVDLPFSRVSSQPRDQTQVSRIARGVFISWATREANSQLLEQKEGMWQISRVVLHFMPTRDTCKNFHKFYWSKQVMWPP